MIRYAARTTLACLGAAALSVTATAGVGALTAPTASAATVISGSVQCNADAVEGIWIQASSGGSGFAAWGPAGQAVVNYRYTLPYGGSWTVHVGCGGSTGHWQYTPNGNVATTAPVVNWFCFTPDGGTAYYYCKIISY